MDAKLHPSKWPTAARRLVLDIETVPTDAAMAIPYPSGQRTPPANYKSAETIAKWREQDELDWAASRVKTYSLNPRFGRILCVGMAMTVQGDDPSPEPTVVTAWTPETEPSLLRLVWDWIAAVDGNVCTWNGTFDLRWIWLRSLGLGVEMPDGASDWIRAWFRKYDVSRHFDCKGVLTQWDTPVRGEGLSEWAAFLGMPGKPDGIDGSKVYELFQDNQLQTIKQYCAADVRTTREIYYRIAPMLDPLAMYARYSTATGEPYTMHDELAAQDAGLDGPDAWPMQQELAQQRMGLF